MAFKETYTNAVQQARDEARPVSWTPSYGFDKGGRAAAVRDAAEKGRIGRDRALGLLAHIGPEYADQHRAALEGPQSVSALLPKFGDDAA